MLIVGLGNPGYRFDNTRHNAGFLFVDKLAEHLKIQNWQEKFNGLVSLKNDESIGRIVLLKPQTFMNLSGESVVQCVNFFKQNREEIIIAHDELDLPVGKIKVKNGGSHRGHNGVRNISQLLGYDSYKRIMIGIDRPVGNIPVSDYVLSKFSDEELIKLENSFSDIIKKIDQI